MTKGKDNSEQVRIRTEYAEYIRSESERLGKSFLSTLYWIVDNYRVQQAGIQPMKAPQVVKETPQATVAKTSDLKEETILDNLNDFE